MRGLPGPPLQMRTAPPGMTDFSSLLSKTSRTLSVVAALGIAIFTGTAHAQQNSDVSVNLEALGLNPTLEAGSEPRLILKYPGSSTATRQVPQLRYPNVPAPTARPTPPKTPTAAVKTAPAPAPKAAAEKPSEPAAKVVATPVTTPAPVEAKAETRSTAAASAAPVAETPATPAAPVAEAPVAEPQVAALTPPAAVVTALPEPDPAILRVLFDEDTAAIIGSARKDLDAIGESLRYDPRRIELKAYGGEPGDKASEARRISLKRGLAVRAYLIGLGIDSRRIDVRALGGVTDTGSPDRVDVAYSGA